MLVAQITGTELSEISKPCHIVPATTADIASANIIQAYVLP